MGAYSVFRLLISLTVGWMGWLFETQVVDMTILRQISSVPSVEGIPMQRQVCTPSLEEGSTTLRSYSSYRRRHYLLPTTLFNLVFSFARSGATISGGVDNTAGAL